MDLGHPHIFYAFNEGNKWIDTTPFYLQDASLTFATRQEAEECAKASAIEYCGREYFGYEVAVVAIPD
jgi:hypothetical protein